MYEESLTLFTARERLILVFVTCSLYQCQSEQDCSDSDPEMPWIPLAWRRWSSNPKGGSDAFQVAGRTVRGALLGCSSVCCRRRRRVWRICRPMGRKFGLKRAASPSVAKVHNYLLNIHPGGFTYNLTVQGPNATTVNTVSGDVEHYTVVVHTKKG